MDDFDEKKDYYRVLGVSSNATAEELKAAYIKLALQHHPDSATHFQVDQVPSSGAQFIQVNEAWAVLSKPLVRQRYDTLRSRHLGSAFSGSSGSSSIHGFGTVQTEISEGYNTQKVNYYAVQKKASSNWMDLQEKYKSEKWRKLTLKEKKMHRARPITTVSGSLSSTIVSAVLCGFVIYGAYKYNQNR